jgi:hypothetical protein
LNRQLALLLPTLLAAVLVGCLFDGAETEGMICESHDQCGVGIDCLQGICGGVNACATGLDLCADDDTLQTCQVGTPTNLSCTDVCAAGGLGESLICETSPQTGEAGCYCDESSSFCDQEGVVECADDDDIRGCFNGVWEQQDCDWLCGSDGLGSGDSCGYDMQSGSNVCWCTGDPCVDGEQYCLSQGALALCDGGAWTQVACDDAGCGPDGVSLGCGFLGSVGDETCLCGV